MSARRQLGAVVSPRISITEPITEPLAAAPAWSAPASLSISQQSGTTHRQSWRLILRVFLPFTVAFFLSYLFRTINALISSELSSELALDAADLGFLTSVYFLTFAALQLPEYGSIATDPDASKARCFCSRRPAPSCSACRRNLQRSFWAALSSGSELQRRSLADSKRSSCGSQKTASLS
jgi:hypothetical protein